MGKGVYPWGKVQEYTEGWGRNSRSESWGRLGGRERMARKGRKPMGRTKGRGRKGGGMHGQYEYALM